MFEQWNTKIYLNLCENYLYTICIISFVLYNLLLHQIWFNLPVCFLPIINIHEHTVDSRYLEFDGTMENIRVNRSSTQEELRRYRKCSLFNDERETTRAKFWRVKTSMACPYSRNDFKHIRCFCCCFFLSVKFFESCETTDSF